MNIPDYVFFIAFAIIAFSVFTIIKNKISARKLRQKLLGQWGKKPAEKYRDEEMQAIKYYYDNLVNTETKSGRSFLDDITWNDLDMDDIFKRINSTHSSVGEEYLYALLREPVIDEKILSERNRLMELFHNDEKLRIRLQYILARLGKKRFAGVSNYFFSTAEYAPFKRIRYIIQLAVFLLSPCILAYDVSAGVLAMIACFILNMTTYYKAKNELSAELDTMSYMVNLITCSIKIAQINSPDLEEYAGRIRKLTSGMKSTGIKSFYQIFYNTQNELFEYFKIIFLAELITFEGINKKVIKHRKELRELYELVGLLDSMLSLASYRDSLKYYSVPDLFHTDTTHGLEIAFQDIYHPLIHEPVANSLEMKKPVLITGSNASGKSTFLKTTAVNAIFAQTICTCLAKSYRSCYFRIYTSMALRDNLLNKESYYIAELKSLKRILDSLNEETPIFCVIDEVLRGTNTIERIAASSQIMQYLSGKNCICLTATHDIELVGILKEHFDNYHFRESFRENNIIFDYKIYPGKSSTRNAIKLLEIMGYPEETVTEARISAEHFEREGTWQPGSSQ